MRNNGSRIHKLVFFFGTLLLFILCTIPVYAGGTKDVYNSCKASELNSASGMGVVIHHSYFHLEMDQDLSLMYLKPSSDFQQLEIVITGNHTLTLNNVEAAYNTTDYASALMARKLVIENATVNALSSYSGIRVQESIQIKNAEVNAKGSLTAIFSLDDSITIQNSTVNCSDSINGNGVSARKNLTIENSSINVYGYCIALRGDHSVTIKNSTVTASTKNYGVASNGDVSISDGKVDIKLVDGETGSVANWAGISALGSVIIDKSELSSKGLRSGIHGGIDPGAQIKITDSKVTAEGGKSAISSANPIMLGSELSVLEPTGGRIGTINWNPSFPYGIVNASGETATYAVIGVPTPTVTDKKASEEETIGSLLPTGEQDLTGSAFLPLQAKGKGLSRNTIKLSWKAVPGAKRYDVYGAKCGKRNSYTRLASVGGISWIQRKLKKDTYYRYVIIAYGDNGVLAISKTAHVATKGGRVGNPLRIKLNRKKVELSLEKKRKKTIRVKASIQKKQRVKKHRKLAWESDNTAVATVNQRGKITAVGKGTCYVYAYAQNGVSSRVKVIVR